MGSVYKAKQLDANRIVALKLLHPSLVETEEFQKRFLRECKLLSQIANEHIITFYHAAINSEGYPYAVFEYLGGQTLRQVLQEKGRLSVSESINLLLQVSEAMQSAHSLNIVHRDLKPENIMMGKRGNNLWVKVFDFGLSKESITEERESQRLTLTGDIIGTAAYMSPEQCKGGKAEARSDIYALACIAYECLAGKALFDEATPMAALNKHLNEDPAEALNDLCSFCPPALTDLLKEMLAKSPADRPSSMTAVSESLGKAQAQLRQGITSSKPKDKNRGKKLAALGAGASLLLIAALASFFWMSMQNEQAIKKKELEESQRLAKIADAEERNFAVGVELIETAHEALMAQNFKDCIRDAKRVANLRNDSCEYLTVRLRALRIWTQAANFSQLEDPDPPLERFRTMVNSDQTKKCLSKSEQHWWMFAYLLLAANVNQTKGREPQAIALTLEFEKLHNQVPEDQKQNLEFLLMLISRGHSLRNTQQFQKAYETDQRALKFAKQMESEGADHIYSIYPSLIVDARIMNEKPEKVAQMQKEYAEVFEQSFTSENSEGMMRSILSAQDDVLRVPSYVPSSAPLILKAWKAAEMFPEISTHLRCRALQQLLHLKQRQAPNGTASPKDLREIANNFLLILKQAEKPSLGESYYGARRELAQELEALLTSDGQAELAAKVKKANENFHLDR